MTGDQKSSLELSAQVSLKTIKNHGISIYSYIMLLLYNLIFCLIVCNSYYQFA